jgi:hypothetical protein
MTQARVRSWKAFVMPATLVTVHRHGGARTVTPERHDKCRVDVFYPMVEDEVGLPDCTMAHPSPALSPAIDAAGR